LYILALDCRASLAMTGGVKVKGLDSGTSPRMTGGGEVGALDCFASLAMTELSIAPRLLCHSRAGGNL
jgi:hypothetical protein